MTARPRVAIIGAGIAGLAHADVLERYGYTCVLFERAARAGGVWAQTYAGVTLQNTWWDYHLSSFPWPFEPELHPTGAEVLRYLEALVEARGFDLRLQHEVVAVREQPDGTWEVRFRVADEPEARTEHFDRVVVSVGLYLDKARPQLPGEASFQGRVMTERDLQDGTELEGARVVVVGFGKSALDMATLATSSAAAVHHVFRTPRWTVPRRLFGVPSTSLLFNRFGSVWMPSWVHPSVFERFLHRRTLLIAAFWRTLQAVLATLARWQARGTGAEGAARLETVLPDHAFLPDLRSASALTPPGYYAHVASGGIQPHHAEVVGFTEAGLQLADGAVIEADVVVLSIGSRPPTFPFLAPEVRALLESESDGAQLYRHLVHPELPTLGFAGFNASFMFVPGAEIGALWLAALWDGKLELPSTEAMKRATAHVRRWKREHLHFEPSRARSVNTRFQQYLDVLLTDLGVNPYRKLPNVVAEVVAPYAPADYAGVVDEFLAQPPGPPHRPSPLPT